MAYRQKHDSRIRQAPPRRKPQQGPSKKTVPPNKKKKKLRNSGPPSGGSFSSKFVAAVFFIFVFVYIGHSAWAFVTPEVNTMIVRMNTVTEPRSIPGVIIRDEQVHYANNSGYVQFMVQENERVSVNTQVVRIVNDPISANTAREYLSAVENMASNTQARRPATETTDSGIQRINDDLANIVNGRIYSFTALNLNEIYAMRDNLNNRISARNQINTGSAIVAWEPLAREYERHRAAHDASISNMYAAGSGIMSRLIDGHEASLTRDMIGNLTRDDIRISADYGPLTLATEVQEGDALFKTVGNVWYIAAYMPNDMVQAFTEGAMRIVYLHNASTDNYEPHNVRVERIEYGIRYTLVVFRNTRHVTEFMNQRNISIRTASGVRRGLEIPDTAIVTRRHYRIPLGSIHGEEGSNYVLVLTETGNTRLFVTIDERTDYYAYIPVVPELTVGSLLIPRDDGIHVLLNEARIRVLNGVYAIVFGTVTFRTINIGESGLEAGYVLLDPSLNHGINEFSTIVTDASTVVAGQIVR